MHLLLWIIGLAGPIRCSRILCGDDSIGLAATAVSCGMLVVSELNELLLQQLNLYFVR